MIRLGLAWMIASSGEILDINNAQSSSGGSGEMRVTVNRFVYGFLVIMATALMGSSFAIGKIGMEYVSPLLLVGLRFTLAGTALALLIWRRRLPRKVSDWLRITTIGLLQTTGVMGSIFLSMRTITASESSILTFVNPLFVIVFGTAFLGMRYRSVQWIGVIVGFLGVFLALGFDLHVHAGTWIGLFGAVSWAMATLLVKRWSTRLDVWVLSAYQMLIGGVATLILAFAVERPRLDLNAVSMSALVWLVVMGSIVQFTVWFRLLQQGDPAKTSAFLFLAPFFGILSGWLMLGETIQWFVAAGSFLIFIGIFLVNWPQAKTGGQGKIDCDTRGIL